MTSSPWPLHPLLGRVRAATARCARGSSAVYSPSTPIPPKLHHLHLECSEAFTHNLVSQLNMCDCAAKYVWLCIQVHFIAGNYFLEICLVTGISSKQTFNVSVAGVFPHSETNIMCNILHLVRYLQQWPCVPPVWRVPWLCHPCLCRWSVLGGDPGWLLGYCGHHSQEIWPGYGVGGWVQSTSGQTCVK